MCLGHVKISNQFHDLTCTFETLNIKLQKVIFSVSYFVFFFSGAVRFSIMHVLHVYAEKIEIWFPEDQSIRYCQEYNLFMSVLTYFWGKGALSLKSLLNNNDMMFYCSSLRHRDLNWAWMQAIVFTYEIKYSIMDIVKKYQFEIFIILVISYFSI